MLWVCILAALWSVPRLMFHTNTGNGEFAIMYTLVAWQLGNPVKELFIMQEVVDGRGSEFVGSAQGGSAVDKSSDIASMVLFTWLCPNVSQC